MILTREQIDAGAWRHDLRDTASAYHDLRDAVLSLCDEWDAGEWDGEVVRFGRALRRALDGGATDPTTDGGSS